MYVHHQSLWKLLKLQFRIWPDIFLNKIRSRWRVWKDTAFRAYTINQFRHIPQKVVSYSSESVKLHVHALYPSLIHPLPFINTRLRACESFSHHEVPYASFFVFRCVVSIVRYGLRLKNPRKSTGDGVLSRASVCVCVCVYVQGGVTPPSPTHLHFFEICRFFKKCVGKTSWLNVVHKFGVFYHKIRNAEFY